MQNRRLARLRQLAYGETNPALKAQYAFDYAAELEKGVIQTSGGSQPSLRKARSAVALEWDSDLRRQVVGIGLDAGRLKDELETVVNQFGDEVDFSRAFDGLTAVQENCADALNVISRLSAKAQVGGRLNKARRAQPAVPQSFFTIWAVGEGTVQGPKFAFHAADLADAKSKLLNWLRYHGDLGSRNDYEVRPADQQEIDRFRPEHDFWVSKAQVGGRLNKGRSINNLGGWWLYDEEAGIWRREYSEDVMTRRYMEVYPLPGYAVPSWSYRKLDKDGYLLSRSRPAFDSLEGAKGAADDDIASEKALRR